MHFYTSTKNIWLNLRRSVPLTSLLCATLCGTHYVVMLDSFREVMDLAVLSKAGMEDVTKETF